MRAFLSVLIFVTGLAGWAVAADEPATFEAAESAYIALDFDRALSGYRKAGANEALPEKDRARAYRQLGVVSWRIKADFKEAEKAFGLAMARGAETSLTQVERARMLVALKRFPEAIAAGDLAYGLASTDAERRAATLAYARAVLASLETKNLADQTEDNRALLGRVRDRMLPYAKDTPVPLDLSEAMLGVGLRLGDGGLALTGWQSYAREGAEKGGWVEAGQKLSRAFGDWTGEPSVELRQDLFDGLKASQFFDLATVVASDKRLADADAFVGTPSVRETIAYANALKSFSDTTDGYYKDLANKKGDSKAWLGALSAAGKKLWSELGLPEGGHTQAALSKELRTRFGAYINIGTTGAVEDMHYGHVFIDDQREVEQYGHKATVRLISLDRIISNGYESWVWDGRQAHGGWAETDRIIIVRPGYADSAFRIWTKLTDPAERAEAEAKIKALSALDDANALKDDGAFLPGLTVRLGWKGDNALLDRLKAQGLSGADLKREFVITLSRIKLDASIFAHEGRHVLDQIAFKDLSAEELEFRAKLSEIAFCEDPFLTFDSIFNANMADPTSPHGRANKRVAVGIVTWMKAHQGEISGLDPKRPMLPQFDLLTIDQMRDAGRSMDPWAPKR